MSQSANRWLPTAALVVCLSAGRAPPFPSPTTEFLPLATLAPQMDFSLSSTSGSQLLPYDPIIQCPNPWMPLQHWPAVARCPLSVCDATPLFAFNGLHLRAAAHYGSVGLQPSSTRERS
ncbi:hypothetical protein B0H63DRAFT_254944 [Podospora didyma]|uniref:Secreted protein n=1 Tax=Podospora didyma TaxID=330526 RepID=A0AAE0KDJ8_9PEZI|nr:hypothetical protein B0H63DRAFT_254944 [Podospora didyma]